MEHITISQYYLFLKNWWETLDLTNYEKNYLNEEIISFNQQLIRLKDRKIRIGVYGKAGVGKSFILNFLLNEKHFKTDIINGSTKRVEGKEWLLKHKNLKGVELLDCPGFDFCNIESPKNTYSEININYEDSLVAQVLDENNVPIADVPISFSLQTDDIGYLANNVGWTDSLGITGTKFVITQADMQDPNDTVAISINVFVNDLLAILL